MATKLEDAVLSAGQNEGIERAVLPLPQMSLALNVRMRKTARWGKRWGYGLLNTANLSASPRLPRCLGPGFALVDDQCNDFDQTANAFVNPSSLNGVPAGFETRIPCAVSGWLPDRAFFPAPTQSTQHQTATPCATAFFGGYLWTVKQVTDPNATTDQMFRIVATDPTDDTLVSVRDLRAVTAAGGGIQYPHLAVSGAGTLGLAYFDAPTTSMRGRLLTSVAGGFGAEVPISGAGIISFDFAPYTGSSNFLFAITYAGNTLTVGQLTGAGLIIASNFNFVDVNPITSCTIVGSTTTPVFVAFGVNASNVSRIRAYTTGFGGGLAGTSDLSTTDGARPLLVILPGGGVRVVYSSRELTTPGGLPIGAFSVRDMSNTGGVQSLGTPAQYGACPISTPFLVGTKTYVWCQLLINQPITGGGGYAVLLRIDSALAEAGGIAHFPIEMSVQDFVTSTGAGLRVTDLKGLPNVTQIGTSATWAALMPIIYRAPASTGDVFVDFRIVQAKHFSDGAARRGVMSFPADSTSFIPLGALARVDARGAVEVGFVHAPGIGPFTTSVGGGLTSSSTYYYSAVYTSRNDAGRLEISAPTVPAKAVMPVSNGTNTFVLSPLYLSGRQNAQIEIYRTLSNGQTFYLVATISASVNATQISYVDTKADTAIATQPVIYTQVGQQLANGFPPASRFGCSGGARVFVGGLLRPDTAVASKLILGDQTPTFCDSDAFKIITPAPMTGIAWMDALVTFTAEGIYVSTGDGPTDDGVGDFGTASRLPFQIGCIEPRSVITVDEGTFFQSNRGLYLLPRGFGAPIAAGDQVMATLAQFPIITGVAAMVKPTEQTIRWSCVDAACVNGRQIVYDLVHKAWSIDSILGGGVAAVSCIGQWLNNEIVSAEPGLNQLRLTNASFADNVTAIRASLETGDVRLFGPQSRGIVSRVGIMTELRSACTLEVLRITDRATSPIATRVFTGVGPDDVVGQIDYTQADLGSAEVRSIASLRVNVSENSTTEGLAFIALAIEHGASEGLRLEKPADRIV